MVVFVAGVIEGKRDFNYCLCFSQPPRKIRELLLSSRDFSQLLWSQKAAFERHTPILGETLTPRLLTAQVTVKAL